jgi:hypothetical protein
VVRGVKGGRIQTKELTMNEFQQLGVGQPQLGQQQLAPQGFLGGLIGAPLGGLVGRGIGSLFGYPQLGGQIGQYAGGIGGGFLPLSADPTQQMGGIPFPAGSQGIVPPHLQQIQHLIQHHLQQVQQLQQLLQAQPSQQMQQIPQQQFGAQAGPQGGVQAGVPGQQGQMAPQGWFGDAIGQFGRPLGGLIGGIAGNQGLGSSIGAIASQLGGMLPFSVDPYQMQQLQQLQQLQQQQQQQQQQQLSPQGWFGNAISQFGRPLGGLIGGIAGNQGLGSTIGGIASQLGGMLPFNVDPYAAYAQQAQMGAQQLQPGQYPYGYGPGAGMGQGIPPTVH